jgi:hypothetical protein
MANYFSINNISIVSPTGSIMAFLGTGPSDPDGWVIMNGVPRVNSGQYNTLLSMGIGTLDVNNSDYIPPNYNGAFLRGSGGSGSYIGPNINTTQSDQAALLNHNHGININDPGHSHEQTRVGSDNQTCGNGGVTTAGLGNADLRTYTVGSTTGITASSNDASIVQETRPFNYGVNWILKL